jgi:predicted RNase H-like nuclease (RuvC/YqgF family)
MNTVIQNQVMQDVDLIASLAFSNYKHGIEEVKIVQQDSIEAQIKRTKDLLKYHASMYKIYNDAIKDAQHNIRDLEMYIDQQEKDIEHFKYGWQEMDECIAECEEKMLEAKRIIRSKRESIEGWGTLLTDHYQHIQGLEYELRLLDKKK